MSVWPELSGCRIQRIDRPSEALFAITLGRRDFRSTLVAVLSGASAGVGLCDERPKGRSADALVQRLRKHLGGAKVEAAGAHSPTVVRLSLSTREGPRMLDFILAASEGNVAVRHGDGRVVFSLGPLDAQPSPGRSAPAIPPDLEALRLAGPALVATHAQLTAHDARRPLEQAIARRIKSLQRRLVAIEGDAERARDAGRLRSEAALVLSNLHVIADNASEAVVVDYTDGTARKVTLRFERGLGPKQSAEAWFKRARRLERGVAIAEERHSHTEGEIASLRTLRTELDVAQEPEQIEAIRERARAFGVGREASSTKGPRQPTARRAYREYVAQDGHVLLVGRGARDNDELTMKIARPHDLFVHARGVSGTHVIVRLAKGESCPPETLVDAATLAAHFSGSRGDTIVEVAHTTRRHVRKPKGSAAGSVVVQQEKVIQLRAEPGRLERLLATIKA